MAKFITVHTNGHEVLVNLDWVECVIRKENGKAQIASVLDHSKDIDIDESYEEVTRWIRMVCNG